MSTNDPFQDDFGNQPGYGQTPPAKKSYKGLLLGCGAVALLGLLICCGGGIYMARFGMNVAADEFKRQLSGNPVIVEHIGDIKSMEMSMSATMEQAQQAQEKQAGGAPELAFTIEGTKGSGIVLIQQDNQGGQPGIQSATLVMPDGNKYPIEIGSGRNADFGPEDISIPEVETGEIELNEVETSAPDNELEGMFEPGEFSTPANTAE